jgi:primosomal protein N' (replication factor Y)
MLREKLQNRVLGPEYPMISKIKNLYIKNIMVKLEKSENLKEQKREILETINRFKGEASFKAVRVIIDVDPV